MRILFAAHADSWGGCLKLIREELPQHCFEATGGFWLDSLEGFDILIPTMCPVTRDKLATANQLKLIQQCGAGLEGVDLQAAWERNIRVANVPTDISGNAESVAELAVYFMIGLSRDVRGMAQSFANQRLGVPRGQALSGKVAGLVGLGGIGRALAQRLKAFDMRLMGIKRSDPTGAQKSLGLEWVGGPIDLKELLGKSELCRALPSLHKRTQAIAQSRHFCRHETRGLLD